MFRKGQIVKIEFLDHVQDGTDPMCFVVFGRLANVTKESFTVECWTHSDKKVKADGNETKFVILRCAIKSMCKLVEA